MMGGTMTSSPLMLTCLTLFLEEETLNIPTVLSPCCSRCRMQVRTMGGTLGRTGEGERTAAAGSTEPEAAAAAILETASSRQLAKETASRATDAWEWWPTDERR